MQIDIICQTIIMMINPPKVDYGLFRASRSHNPPYIRALMVLTHHSALM